MGEEGDIRWKRGVYYQARLTAQSKATIVSFHHDLAQNNAVSSSTRNALATFVKNLGSQPDFSYDFCACRLYHQVSMGLWDTRYGPGEI